MNQELKNKLAKGVVRISFNKKNGTLRTMEATTYGPMIPTEFQPKNEADTNYSDEVQRVFDTEINEWRSFRWDSLVSYTTAFAE
jgi:hypothetical protein